MTPLQSMNEMNETGHSIRFYQKKFLHVKNNHSTLKLDSFNMYLLNSYDLFCRYCCKNCFERFFSESGKLYMQN